MKKLVPMYEQILVRLEKARKLSPEPLVAERCTVVTDRLEAFAPGTELLIESGAGHIVGPSEEHLVLVPRHEVIGIFCEEPPQ